MNPLLVPLLWMIYKSFKILPLLWLIWVQIMQISVSYIRAHQRISTKVSTQNTGGQDDSFDGCWSVIICRQCWWSTEFMATTTLKTQSQHGFNAGCMRQKCSQYPTSQPTGHRLIQPQMWSTRPYKWSVPPQQCRGSFCFCPGVFSKSTGVHLTCL